MPSIPSSFRAPHLLAIAALGLAAAVSLAQFTPPSKGTLVHDPAALKPPAGARVAIIEFEDLECPDCARANPLLLEASTKYKIPWVRHDFLIPMHNWSRNAAINARFFDQKSKTLGDEYRDEVFASQSSIYSPGSLAEFTQKFAQNHGITMPFAIDPQGKLANEVNADVALSRRMGLKSTPTIFVVEANGKGAPFTQVLNPKEQLYTTIDRAMADTAAPAKAAVAKKSSGK
jgi:protein-disulfide isomerase